MDQSLWRSASEPLYFFISQSKPVSPTLSINPKVTFLHSECSTDVQSLLTCVKHWASEEREGGSERGVYAAAAAVGVRLNCVARLFNSVSCQLFRLRFQQSLKPRDRRRKLWI